MTYMPQSLTGNHFCFMPPDDRQFLQAHRALNVSSFEDLWVLTLHDNVFSALLQAATKSSDLKLVGLEDITPHYVRTLATWRENMFANREQVQALGLDDRFLRTWDYYFSYCEGGFAEGHIGDVQLLFAKPRYEVPA